MTNLDLIKLGRAAYDKWASSEPTGLKPPPWHEIGLTEQKRWASIVSAAIDASEPAALAAPPETYVDGLIVSAEVSVMADSRVTLDLKARYEGAQRFNRTPGSTDLKLAEIIKTANSPGGRLRLSATTEQRAELEASLVDSDGSIRDLHPLEGTW